MFVVSSLQPSYPVLQAGLFSAVSAAFVIDIYQKLQPNSGDQSAALLRAILLTLNQSAIPDEAQVVPPVQETPPSEIVAASVLLFASPLISLLAALIATLGKQWLNHYMQHAGGSMIERCGDRQRKFDGLQKWPFHLFIESLPLILQLSLLLLACGLCRYMASINTIVAAVLIALTVLGILFYVGIVIASASSHDCPFQTPISAPLRGLCLKIRPYLVPVILPIISAPQTLGKVGKSCFFAIRPFLIRTRHHFHNLLEKIKLGVCRVSFCFPWAGFNILFPHRHPPLPTQGLPPSPETINWISSGELDRIQKKNSDDTRCVSWILRNITDTEVLDISLQRAGTIRWFDDGTDAEPPYDVIVSTFHACFGADRRVYPGLRDRAYYSARTILWIHALAIGKSKRLPFQFSLPVTPYTASSSDRDLTHLLRVTESNLSIGDLYITRGCGTTPAHLQWLSKLLLHVSWATFHEEGSAILQVPTVDSLFSQIADEEYRMSLGVMDHNTPQDALLNYILELTIFLHSPVGEEVLRIENKSCAVSGPCTPSYLYSIQ